MVILQGGWEGFKLKLIYVFKNSLCSPKIGVDPVLWVLVHALFSSAIQNRVFRGCGLVLTWPRLGVCPARTPTVPTLRHVGPDPGWFKFLLFELNFPGSGLNSRSGGASSRSGGAPLIWRARSSVTDLPVRSLRLAWPEEGPLPVCWSTRVYR